MRKIRNFNPPTNSTHLTVNPETSVCAICDAAMNDMLRPSLYGSFMDIQPIYLRQNEPTHFYDVVGPICETGDFLGYGRELSILQGDLLCVCDAGAYGFSMT